MLHPVIESRLSEEQRQPFYNTKKHTCILAAAGSGKTRVLSHMIANDILNGIKPSEIIAFTFTEKAAAELFSRVYRIVMDVSPETDIAEIKISTIHAWCMDYLLNDSRFYGFEGMDELQQSAMITRIYDYLELANTYQKSFPKGIDEFIADVEVFFNEYIDINSVPDILKPALSKYVDFLNQNRLMDFGFMVRSAVDLLNDNGPIQNLKRLYIDEYQDVNRSQVLLAKKMLSNETQLCVVGHDLQCIYNWRGSDVTSIINFSSEFPDSSTFSLTTNYRSHSSIVAAANASSAFVTVRADKPPMAPVKTNLEKYVVHLSASDANEEADVVAELVKKFIQSIGA